VMHTQLARIVHPEKRELQYLFRDIVSAMGTLTYTGVSPDDITVLLTGLKQNGSSVQLLTQTGPAGQWRVMGSGVVATATYDGVSVLTVQILSKPFFIPEAMIDAGIKKALGRG
jgi:lysophospholipid acyltransferase (LPLAT)-like uncharacterized protein